MLTSDTLSHKLIVSYATKNMRILYNCQYCLIVCVIILQISCGNRILRFNILCDEDYNLSATFLVSTSDEFEETDYDVKTCQANVNNMYCSHTDSVWHLQPCVVHRLRHEKYQISCNITLSDQVGIGGDVDEWLYQTFGLKITIMENSLDRLVKVIPITPIIRCDSFASL